MTETVLRKEKDYWIGCFQAMASPCEVLTEATSHAEAARILETASREAHRIEQKFSRYLPDNIIYRINNAGGASVTVDEETARLLDYAEECYNISDGLFDLTSGILRRVWKFDGGDHLPTKESVQALLNRVGWHKVIWKRPRLTLPRGMEIDLGGIGKEYAVDSAATLISKLTQDSFLVNFGGDLFANSVRKSGDMWGIGMDDPSNTGTASIGFIQIPSGGVATSGDARRFLLKDGVRYGHILNPKSGWPIPDAPRSVTVHADSCIEAGTLATLAILKGAEAENFLREQQVHFWCESS